MTTLLALFKTKKMLGFIELHNLFITSLNFFYDLKSLIITHKGKIKNEK